MTSNPNVHDSFTEDAEAAQHEREYQELREYLQREIPKLAAAKAKAQARAAAKAKKVAKAAAAKKRAGERAGCTMIL